MTAPRGWGFWTRGKLDILRDYLNSFTTTTKVKAPTERIYLDLFAGREKNVDRITKEPLQGSPWIALSIDDPPFTRLRFFEIARARTLEKQLRTDFPGRDLRVYDGDCNQTIHHALVDLKDLNWAPTFAFIDPNGPDYMWSTLEALAAFKAGRKYKVELWMLFPEPMFVRFLCVNGGQVRPEDAERISSMYGTDIWTDIYEARLTGKLAPNEARNEYVNLMRWRLESVLGYRWTHTFAVRNERGGPIYHMIFASDNDAGNRIMRDLYTKALKEFPKMRERAIDQRKGALRLFDATEYAEATEAYEHEPPRPPFGSD